MSIYCLIKPHELHETSFRNARSWSLLNGVTQGYLHATPGHPHIIYPKEQSYTWLFTSASSTAVLTVYYASHYTDPERMIACVKNLGPLHELAHQRTELAARRCNKFSTPLIWCHKSYHKMYTCEQFRHRYMMYYC